MNVLIFLLLILIIYALLCNIGVFYIGGDMVKDLKINPRSKSEQLVIDHIEKITNVKFPTVYPSWCRDGNTPIELDGYNDKLKIAVEVNGPQHYKWFTNNEPYEEYFKRIRRDIIKRNLCFANNVCLIILDTSINRIHWYNYIKSRLYDCKFLSDKPSGYIHKYEQPVYRNSSLEADLNLTL